MTQSSFVDAQVEAVIRDFTLYQLKEVLATVSVGAELGSLHNKTKEQIIGLLSRTGDAKKKALVAHRLEALTPYKHLFIYSIKTATTYRKLSADCRKRLPDLVSGFAPLPSHVGSDLQLQLCLLDDEHERTFVKFAHLVETWETISSSANERTQRIVRKRHPVVVTLYPKLAIAVVSFPGFTQNATNFKERLQYTGIGKEAGALVSQLLGIDLQGLQVKSAIENLLADPTAQVFDVKRSIKPQGGGKIVVDSWGDQSGLAQFLAKFFKGGNVAVDADSVRSLLQSGSDDDIWLAWRKLDLLTRFAFHEAVPEVLVLWQEAGPDLTRIERALDALISHRTAVPANASLAASGEIENAAVGTVITPIALSQRYQLTIDEAMRILFDAVHRNWVELRFRVKTDAMIEKFENRWRQTLADFPDSVVDETGNAIDLTDGRNIEVAFERKAS
jgi:hypothetical protein